MKSFLMTSWVDMEKPGTERQIGLFHKSKQYICKPKLGIVGRGMGDIKNLLSQ